MRIIPTWPLLVIALSVVACSDKAEKKQTTSSTPMPDMPGMAKGPDSVSAPDTGKNEKSDGTIATTLLFTPAQLAHGKVAWSPAVLGSVALTAAVPGQVTTDEDHTVRLGAPARGRVTAVKVSPGDHVGSGEILVVLESPEAGAAQADVSKAQAAVSSRRAQARYANAAKDRAERLLALKSIPRQDFDRAVADDELAQSELLEAEAELRRASTLASQLGADANATGSIVLRAPRAGVILSRSAVPGAVVEAGMPLVVVTDPSRLWLTVSAPEQFAGLFHSGGQLRFVVPAFADTFTARVTAVGAGLDPDTRTLQVRGAADSRGQRLKSGMLATVFVSGATQATAAILPEDAVQMLQGRATAFVVTPDGKGGARITRRDVEVGPRTNGRIAVLRGVNAGDVVVTSGAFSVKAEFQKGGMPKMEM